MVTEQAAINTVVDEYDAPGLYLIMNEPPHLNLTREHIDKVTSEYWEDENKIPPKAKEAAEFQRCSICPIKEDKHLCNALQPILPFLDEVDRYVSFDAVTAVYKPEANGMIHVSNTTMQDALRYVCLLSLMKYCKVGRTYWKYYADIIPLLDMEDFVRRLYLNIYWLHEGDIDTAHTVIKEMHDHTTITITNQVERLRLICKNDAFLNAFVTVNTITQFLEMTHDDLLKESFARKDYEVIE